MDIGKDTLLIENKGQYSICNLQIYQIYFAKISDHGRYISVPNAPFYSQFESKKKWTLDISGFYTNFYKIPPVPKVFVSKIEKEYLNILVSFERVIDGKSYLCILPGMLVRFETGIERWSVQSEGSAIAGPLGKVCNEPLELAYEYLRRRPFSKDYELYNSSYTLGYTPTGCLGKIDWKN